MLGQPFFIVSSPSFSMKSSKSPTFRLNIRLASAGTVTWPFVLSFVAPNVFINVHLLSLGVRKGLYALLLTILTRKAQGEKRK